MTLGLLAGGDKGCTSDNHQITEGKQQRDAVGVYQAVLEEASGTATSQTSVPPLGTGRDFLWLSTCLVLTGFWYPELDIPPE